jgi:hypothetical protein
MLSPFHRPVPTDKEMISVQATVANSSIVRFTQ